MIKINKTAKGIMDKLTYRLNEPGLRAPPVEGSTRVIEIVSPDETVEPGAKVTMMSAYRGRSKVGC